MKRNYVFTASRHGGFMNYPGQAVTSNARIRLVVMVLFKKWFGSRPVGQSLARRRIYGRSMGQTR